MLALLKKPSAWVPVALSLCMLALLLSYLVAALLTGGIVREQDEGIAAHLFQLWLVLEPFLIGFFALSWLPTQTKEALAIIALQVFAVLVVCAPVFYFNL